jgi:hypothetical protein
MTDHQQKFADLQLNLENQNQLKSQANGGNSILFSYPPQEESLYIEKAKTIYDNGVEFIDVSRLLVEFIDQDTWEDFKDYYNDYKSSPNKVFHSDSQDIDLFDLIIGKIQSACNDNQIPFLIRTGCLLGTGIENVNIMEHPAVMNLSYPLVVFYPSIIKDENLYFLNFKPASKYRCILIP